MPTTDLCRQPAGAIPLIRPRYRVRPKAALPVHRSLRAGAAALRAAVIAAGLAAVFSGDVAAAPPVEAPRPGAVSPGRQAPGLLWQTRLSEHTASAGTLPAESAAAQVMTSHVSPDGCLLAVGTDAGTVFLVDTRSGRLAFDPLRLPAEPAGSASSASDSAGEAKPRPAAPGPGVLGVQFDTAEPGLLHVLTGSSLVRWNLSGRQPERLSVTPVPLEAPADSAEGGPQRGRSFRAGWLSSEGRQIVTAQGSEPQAVLSGTKLEHRRQLAQPIEIDDCRTFPGTSALFASRFGRLYRWNLQTGERTWKTRLEARIRGFSFDATGQRIVALADYVGFQIVDADTGDVLGQLPDPERRSGSDADRAAVAVSPDGTFFVRGAADGSLELWDHITGLRLYRLQQHESPIEHVQFQAAGRQLLSVSQDGTVQCHDLFSSDFFLSPREATSPPEPAEGRSATVADSRAGQYWESLASPDGPTACGAALALAADPALALAVIEHPPSPVPEIRRLIAQLGSPIFIRRREAYRRLRELALTAEEELQQVAGQTASVEVASRIRRLLDRLKGPARGEQRELRQAARKRQLLLTVRVLQWAGTPAARSLLERMAEGKHTSSETTASEARRALNWLRQADSQQDETSHRSGCDGPP